MADEWHWYASNNDEDYNVGPEDSRDAVIEAGREYYDGETIFIVEARKKSARQLVPSARSIIERALEDAADEGDFGDDGDFGLTGTSDDIAMAYAELDAEISAWIHRWKRLFPTPWTFAQTRNAETINKEGPSDGR